MGKKKLGVIGAGKMGSALVKGVLQSGWADPGSILASDVDAGICKGLAEATSVRVSADNSEVAAFADVIVLAVKPNMVGPVLDGMRGEIDPGKVIVSIAAGVRLDTVTKHLPPKTRVVQIGRAHV